MRKLNYGGKNDDDTPREEKNTNLLYIFNKNCFRLQI